MKPNALPHTLNKLFANPFIRNMSWLGSAELVNRLFRLGTTVTLARMFTPQDYGLMALVYTIYEFALSFSMVMGFGAKIIQAKESEVRAICETTYWLNWIFCGAIFLGQCLAAYPIAQWYDNDQLIWPLCVSALVYLVFPNYLVQNALIERRNQLKITALSTVAQSLIANVLTVILALLGLGIWAIVIPMLVSAPVWLVFSWSHCDWRAPRTVRFDQFAAVFRYSKNLLGIELLSKVRLYADYLIVGKFLGVGELGLYYFAFNAGAGITTKVADAYMTSLFPHLCAAREQAGGVRDQYVKSIKIIAMTLVPLVLLQAIAAPFYVPIIFGQKWVEAVPLLILVCLSVLPRTFGEASAELLKAVDQTRLALILEFCFTVIFMSVLFFTARLGVLAVAQSVLICHALILPIMAFGAQRYVFARLAKQSL
ncbi:lipopolysaccharide biosynthesis protein [Lyngbya confervoides]|uniref:Lipopolysaccharide biosynthesis protein n=1 Tax=Lyngbya confervoides BDU141951 TaxID=1574623 RepID=A0ABD4T7X0_9CYAN|nr:lipopolysaccharide biosynthesis protein [Lyngbya confervoides]MCM1984682.1 lipopolysaccharide biosynthesis protein [Lyngbya confervoides BDU141951]